MPKSLIAANAYLYLHRLFRHATTLASLHLRVKGRSLPKQLFLFMFKTLTLGAASSRWNKISHWIARRYSWEKSRWAGNVIWDMAQKKKFPARIIKEIKPCLLKDSNLTPWETPMATCVACTEIT